MKAQAAIWKCTRCKQKIKEAIAPVYIRMRAAVPLRFCSVRCFYWWARGQ